MPRHAIPIYLAILALAPLIAAQTPPPTEYTISGPQIGAPSGTTRTLFRKGAKALEDIFHPAQTGAPAHHTITLYDFSTHTTYSWEQASKPPACSAGTFSGDWGDPFEPTAEVTKGIATGDLKPAGTETVIGILTKVYAGSSPQASFKVWFDDKDGLVIRETLGMAGAPQQAVVDVRRVSFAPLSAQFFAMPAACASVHPPPTAADLISAETGDSADNFVNAIYGPGSKNSCSVILRVVRAGTMAPVTKRFQVAIDTTYDMDHPPHYEYGMHTDGSQTFSGGGIREITSQVRNGMVRIDNPPAYFNIAVNLIKPGVGAGEGLIYRQCSAPTTILYYVAKDPDNPEKGGDWLWAKAGKYATVPAH